MRPVSAPLAAAFVVCLIPRQLIAQIACVEPTGAQFRTVTLVPPNGGLEESQNGATGPVGMAVAPDGRVFVAKMRTGEIRVYNPGANNLTLAGTVPVRFDGEDGLLGIALAPDFATTQWLYALYTLPGAPARTNELARFTVANNQIGNKKVILQFPRDPNNNNHAAGGMDFSGGGVLVIGIGDNTDPFDGVNAGYGPVNAATPTGDAQRTSANTNDLRGKVLRIRPIAFPDNQTPAPGVGATYAIPAGNLWEKINDVSFNPGWDGTDNISLVRREIYTLGHRNPFHPRVDSRTGWIFWGEVGPDADGDNATRGPAGHDEWNLAVGPAFFGHPYCNGYNRPYGAYPGYASFYNCAAPVNNSPNNAGIHHLPPARAACAAYTSGNSTDDDPRFNAGANMTLIAHASETAIGGPMYRYNPALASTVKFPPYYEGKILFFDWSRRNLKWLLMNANASLVAGAAGVRNFAPQGLPVNTASFIDAQFGPDGALYLLKFSDDGYSIGNGPALYRVEYTGAYDNACHQTFACTVCGPQDPVGLRPALHRLAPPSLGGGMVLLPAGYRSVEFFNAAGEKVWSHRRHGAGEAQRLKLPTRLAGGMWRAKLRP